MTVKTIVQLPDGEELISYESGEPAGALMDDPRRGALERRGIAERARRRASESRVSPL